MVPNRKVGLAGALTALVMMMFLAPNAAVAACQHPTDGTSLELLGDVNDSGTVTVSDAVCAILVALWDLGGETPGMEPTCASSVYAADVNCSLGTDISDALVVVELALGSALPAGIDMDGEGCPVACCAGGAGGSVTADAGPDASICEATTMLAAVPPTSGTGEWFVLSGTASINDIDSPTTEVTIPGSGAVTFRWTVSAGCQSDFDDVVITQNGPVSTADAGADQNLPANQPTTTLSAATPSMGTGQWTVVEGTGILTDDLDPQTAVSNLSPGLNVFRWTVTNGPCTSVAEVAVIRPIACNGTNTVTSAADLQNLRVCSSMGSLIMRDVAGPTDLGWLSNLETVSQNIEIVNNDDLISLDGLESLTSVGGWVIIEDNDLIADVDGMANVASIGNYLRIEDNAGLTSLGFSALGSITNDLIIVDNVTLPQCDAESFGAALSASVGNNLAILDNEADVNGVCVGTTSIQGNVCSSASTFQVENDGRLWHLAGCTTFTGNINIEDDAVTDLAPLISLQTLDGVLRFQFTSNLTTLTGLNNLVTITGYLSFTSANGLTQVDGFDSLQSIGDYLLIYNTDNITDVSGFPSLVNVDGGLRIYQCNQLSAISGFPALQTLGNGGFSGAAADYSFYIHQNQLVTDVTGFPNLTSTTGSVGIDRSNLLGDVSGFASLSTIGLDLDINGNGNLLGITGFGQLDTVGRDLRVYNNDDILGLSGFGDLDDIGGQLRVEDNDKLATISGLLNLGTAGDILIHNNPLLTTIDGLTSLVTVGVAPPDALVISANPILDDISGFSGLSSTGGDMRIVGNAALTTLAAFAGLADVGGSLRVETNDQLGMLGFTALGVGTGNGIGEDLAVFDNAALDQCFGLDLRDQVQNDPNGLGIGGTVSVAFNDDSNGCAGVVPTIPVGDCPMVHVVQSPLDLLSLASCTTVGGLDITASSVVDMTGLENLQTITGDFVLENNPNLVSVAELTSLTSIGGTLHIQQNQNLTAIDGMGSLNSIGGDLYLWQNFYLTTLSGLSSLTSIGNDLYVYNNVGLLNFAGLEQLQTIGNELYLYNNGRLNSIAQLTSLTSLESIWGRYNHALTNLQGLEGVTSMSGDIFIRNFNSLADVSGLDGLQTLGGSLTLHELPVFSSLNGLDNLTSIGGHLSLYDARLMTDLQGLGALQSIGVHLQINFCASLASTAGMPNLQSIGSHLWFLNNAALATVQGFDALSSIGSYFRVSDAPALAVVDFPALTTVVHWLFVLDSASTSASLSISFPLLASIGRDFRIENLPSLTSLSMPQLPSVGEDFIIFNNPAYPECEAQELADAIDDTSSGGGGIVGTITVGQNDTNATCP